MAEFAKMVRRGGGGTRPTGSARADDGSDAEDDIPTQAPSAHLAPLFGAICARLGLTARQMAYIFVLGHAKALVSAAVRASVMGPYQAQKVLAGQALRDELERCIETNWKTPVDLAGQTAPVVDLWMGRHELLYSRIFNS